MASATVATSDRSPANMERRESGAPPDVPTADDLINAVKAYHPDVDSVRLAGAYAFAKEKHGEQLRQSGDPYYTHPVQVAMLLAVIRLDECTIMAGLLHDTVEDCDVSLAEIDERFGTDVAELVDGVTKLGKLDYKSEKSKQAENFQKFILATVQDVRVLLVKLADRLHNMRTLHFVPKESSRLRIAGETMEIYAPLARRVGLYAVASELEDLAFHHVNPAARDSIVKKLEELTSENADDLERIRFAIKQIVAERGIEARVKGRRKQPYSIWRKLEKKSISFRDVADIFAFRIIVSDVEECYRLLGAFHTVWACLPDRFRDFISVPKPNGYASLHTTVRASGNRLVELQIRTEAMDETAERGVAAHWTYKNSEYGFDLESSKAAGLDPGANLRAFGELLADGAEPDEFLEHAKLEMYREHVFAFTPKGRLIILPGGAMPLDFAYAVHTAVGDTCDGAKINGVIRTLRTPLKNGDVVEILRREEARPVVGWEALTITGRARSAIRRLIRDREQAEFVKLGRTLIDRDLRRAGLDPFEVDLPRVARRADFETAEALAEAIGRGRYDTADFIRTVFPGYEPVQSIPADRTVLDDSHASRMIAGEDLTPGVTLHLGECCHPIPGDRIIGLREPEKGLVIHTIYCRQVAEYEDRPDLWVDLRWNDVARQGVVAVGRINVRAVNKRGVMASQCSAIAQAGGNITRVETGERTQDFLQLVFDIEVEDLRHLEQIKAALRALAVVESVDRIEEAAN
ncbi:bifunctional (p)ppGpp synthetase/guanosine-3',5'-bis(diphosphate) 3'-pyrophosphohydrolase [Henriciella sp.]|uniref:RelA/SpoT family protein n=1 Tax=Henriciella sp. TaxID=1968823 RepID=UPI0026259781|nr:bifunctional (p)ppGpp synthetase/guanosine-3',5'-bis(diphosphate) 3'-pyrophosphohydrolase [Henriciella sp.]